MQGAADVLSQILTFKALKLLMVIQSGFRKKSTIRDDQYGVSEKRLLVSSSMVVGQDLDGLFYAADESTFYQLSNSLKLGFYG